MHRLVVSILALGMLAACETTGGLRTGGSSNSANSAGESFEFRTARSRDVSVTASRVVIAGYPGFLPTDPNWVQIELRIENVGNRSVTYVGTQARLEDGRVLPGASHSGELAKMPSMLGTAATQVGLGTGATIVGAMLFPPLALVGAMAGGAYTLYNADRQVGRIGEAAERLLPSTSIPPRGYVSGLAFVPAVKGIAGISISYSDPNSGLASGAIGSVYLPRSRESQIVSGVVSPSSRAGAVNAPTPTHRVRTTATLRIGPTTSAQALSVLRAPAGVRDTGERNGDWWKVQDQTGAEGWVFGPLLLPLN
jgi:hypothetical protein